MVACLSAQEMAAFSVRFIFCAFANPKPSPTSRCTCRPNIFNTFKQSMLFVFKVPRNQDQCFTTIKISHVIFCCENTPIMPAVTVIPRTINALARFFQACRLGACCSVTTGGTGTSLSSPSGPCRLHESEAPVISDEILPPRFTTWKGYVLCIHSAAHALVADAGRRDASFLGRSPG